MIKQLAVMIHECILNQRKIERLSKDIYISVDLDETIELMCKQHKLIGYNECILKILSSNEEIDIKSNHNIERIYNTLINNIQTEIDR